MKTTYSRIRDQRISLFDSSNSSRSRSSTMLIRWSLRNGPFSSFLHLFFFLSSSSLHTLNKRWRNTGAIILSALSYLVLSILCYSGNIPAEIPRPFCPFSPILQLLQRADPTTPPPFPFPSPAISILLHNLDLRPSSRTCHPFLTSNSVAQ